MKHFFKNERDWMEEAVLRETDLIQGAMEGFYKAFMESLGTEAERQPESIESIRARSPGRQHFLIDVLIKTQCPPSQAGLLVEHSLSLLVCLSVSVSPCLNKNLLLQDSNAKESCSVRYGYLCV